MIELKAKIKTNKTNDPSGSKSYSVEEFLAVKFAERRKKLTGNTKGNYDLLRRRIITIKETYGDRG